MFKIRQSGWIRTHSFSTKSYAREMSLTIYQVDAFTRHIFHGNPAAICFLTSYPDDDIMQAVAREMNLAETAFLVENETGNWNLRWFTPVSEVDLCGHATLASAHLMFELHKVPLGSTIRFQTRSGELRVVRADNGLLEMDFPAEPVTKEVPCELLEMAIGTTSLFCGMNRMDAFVEISSEEKLRNLNPDMRAIAELPVRGLIVTAKAKTEGFDFVSRFFAPQLNIPEDPVTGSAHCCLAPYWSKKLGKTKLSARQVSPRGGNVQVELQGDRVLLRGEAVTVMKAELMY